MKMQLLLIMICFIMIVAPKSLKAMETPEDVLNKELIHQLTMGPIGAVIGSDWFRGNEKILKIKNDKRHSNILYVTVQVVSFQGLHSPPYVEEIITFKIVGNKIKPVDYFNRVIPESEWNKFHIPTMLNKLDVATSAFNNYVNKLSIWAAYCIFCLACFSSKMLAVPLIKHLTSFEGLTNPYKFSQVLSKKSDDSPTLDTLAFMGVFKSQIIFNL
ncbi:DUF3888 domain-containing protein [Bacillus mycoides]|uniref:DUF3888 domain-containing protein n=1 Tax=Bacillus mycoides TaxID=1405 RepID=UPI0021CD94DF|nr:DUF3888 domain-containing protein [Bacillus mycoides]MCU5653187.1 DUF3888 domain-containing protein [Bacillus mycoides]